MASLNKDLVMIVLQFLREENFKEAARRLEKESGFHFNMRYFEEKVLAGEWDEVEKYLSGFTNVEDNRFSVKIYFELRKHKYLEALDRKDKIEALHILENELKVFSRVKNDLYRDMTLLLSLDNFRENEHLSKYGNMVEARGTMMMELKKIIGANPVFNGKLEFPSLRSARLRTLVNQSLNWQHHLCGNNRPYPDNIKTLYTDHTCGLSKGSLATLPVNFPAAGSANPTSFTRPGVYTPFPVPASAISNQGQGQGQVSTLNRTVTAPARLDMDEYQLLKHLRTAQPVEEVAFPGVPLPTLNEVDAVGKNKGILNPVDDAVNKTTPWQLTAEKIDHPVRCRLVTLNASDAGDKVSQLLYTNAGTGILVLGSSGFQMLYKWVRHENNPSGKATAKELPHLWKPSSGLLMANDIAGVDLQKSSPCIALTKNDSYVMSACGGKVSVFNALTYGVMTTFMSTPPVPTFLAFFPPDNNYVAVGMDDSTIHIYNVRGDEVKCILKGHQDRVTGLAFSTKLNILISSGADAHICIWSTDTWEKKNSFPLQLTTSESCSACTGDTRVQLHHDEIQFLVSHGTQLALYDAENVDRVQRWIPQDALSAQITSAAFSCNSMLVYASFCDGSIGIFDAERLSLRCHLNPSVYLSLKGSQIVYSVVVAAHPQDPYQFAVGLTDGSVKVIEPFEPEGKWEVFKPPEEGFANGRSASTSTSHHAAEQVQR
nr:PREDICTED: topless-related protein 3-like [Daucus carota subsp. sativus]